MTAPASDAKRVPVGIGQIAISNDPGELLVAYGLGSCIAVSCFDPQSHVAGMAHILLPSSEGKRPDAREPARFADTGIDLLLARLTESGATAHRLVVKLAGGAAVLGPVNAGKFKIGERNADAIRERVKRHGLIAAAAEIGGARGRTLELHAATGKTFVRTAASTANEL